MTCDDCTLPPEDDVETLNAWQPDHQLIAAVLARTRHHSAIGCKTDKCWVVAGLTESERMKAEDIADRLHCSLRMVRSLLAEPRTKAFRMYFREAATFREELSLSQHELRVRTSELAAARREADRLREQKDRLIDAAMTGEPIRLCKHNHVMDRYNTYEHPATGKKSCRTCRRKAKADSRRNSDTTVSSTATLSIVRDTDVPVTTPPTCAVSRVRDEQRASAR